MPMICIFRNMTVWISAFGWIFSRSITWCNSVTRTRQEVRSNNRNFPLSLNLKSMNGNQLIVPGGFFRNTNTVCSAVIHAALSPTEGNCSRNKRCPEEEKHPKILVLTRDFCLGGKLMVWFCLDMLLSLLCPVELIWSNSQVASSSWPVGSLMSPCRTPSDQTGSHRYGAGRPLSSCHRVCSGVGARELSWFYIPKKNWWELEQRWSWGIKLDKARVSSLGCQPIGLNFVWQGLELDGLLGPFQPKLLHDSIKTSSRRVQPCSEKAHDCRCIEAVLVSDSKVSFWW